MNIVIFADFIRFLTTRTGHESKEFLSKIEHQVEKCRNSGKNEMEEVRIPDWLLDEYFKNKNLN
ncbi:hypothetical protein [Chryseobacterium proteolyticum]|uniref:hypothetical protein n=1 Tax=Chryseobacterium proteolyticum TaxID=118127 RepID=UPI0039831B2C